MITMLTSLGEERRLAGLEMQPWTTTATVWADPYQPGCRVRCWLWCRPVPEN